MIKMFTGILLLLTNYSFGQPIIIHNTRTAAYVALPKFKLSIVPPAGYDPLPGDSGFFRRGTNPENGGEQIKATKLFLNFSEVKQSLVASGSGSATDVEINSYEGVWVMKSETVEGQALTSLTLAFGNTTYSYIINGFLPSQDQGVERTLTQSIRSAYVDTFGYSQKTKNAAAAKKLNAAQNKFAASFSGRFQIDLAGTGFKEAEVINDEHLIYTLDGAYPPVNDDKSSIDLRYLQGIVSEQSFLEYANLMLNNNTEITSAKVYGQNPVVINGLKGIELKADANYHNTAVPVKVYQVALFDAVGVYLFTGIAYSNPDQTITTFEKIAKTFTHTK
jgi:hypothetical protein